MKILKSICIAFSLYSRIPMPQFKREKGDMKYTVCFFPLIGAAIGAVFFLWEWLCQTFSIGSVCYSLVAAAIPLIITGGFHADGFLDMSDALDSYKSREEKMSILKDAHVGSGAVIAFAVYLLVYAGAVSEISGLRMAGFVAAGFFLSRTLSGIGMLTLHQAKKSGILFTVADAADKKAIYILYVELAACVVFMLWLSPVAGVICAAVSALIFIYYRIRSYYEFGGVTGDAAGWFLMLCELGVVVVGAVCGHI